ncbi:FtsX-like permease family protein [Phenylobacterium sp.]|uniref:ABC transporter permease n=1 Tax=Phenylobacterium sp. TaxID=1871053 RepID=UPI00272F7967|nr:FtsX-like permease family protein [Phenylobacterium sp.]MDP2212864.1 FtsX-like permease family protein [Phenylobacterium sp.]
MSRLPTWMGALDRKLVRELWRMKTQALAIAFVIAGGVAVHLLAAGMLSSLQETRRAYYERYLFADVWAPTVRAPQRLITEIRGIDGVQAATTRLRVPALFAMEGMSAPASGEVLSLPDAGEAAVNRLHLVRGRLPIPGQRSEAVALQAFADAHGLEIGDTVSVTLYGGRRRLTVVGIALSPEHVYAIGPGQFVPDDRLFGVLWMRRGALAQAVNQDEAFNEAVVRLARDASEPAVIAQLDRLLEPYGAPGAYGRADQISDAFVSSEIDQLATMGRVLPPIFLLVAAFLVNVVVSRLIAVQRAGIGLLKAFGYRDRDIVGHYLKLVAVIAATGVLIGGGAGIWLGRGMAELYMEYYRFPFLLFRANLADYATVGGVALLTVVGGAALAVRRAAALSPAEAMTPAPPPDYSRAAGAWITRMKVLDQQSRMILRQIIRWPWRAALTVAGIAASGALLIGTMSMMDGIKVMIDSSFTVSNPHDVSVSFVESRSRGALFSLAREDGVLTSEPFRIVPVRLRHGAREERVVITGAPLDGTLSRMVDSHNRPVWPHPGGLVLSGDLAAKLQVKAGDLVEAQVTEGRRPLLSLPVAAVTTSYVGSGARMELADLNRALGEGSQISGVWLTIDGDQAEALYTRLKETPMVAGVGLQAEAAKKLAAMLDENLGRSILIFIFFAGLIASGVVYNTVRISFAERQRELASLRVLGFSRADVSYILLGEVAFLTLLALPLGAAAGTGLAWYLAQAMSSDLFRLPFAIAPATFGVAGAVVLLVTIVASLMVRAQIDRLDMAEVLKTGE